jgi:hypothetical protein
MWEFITMCRSGICSGTFGTRLSLEQSQDERRRARHVCGTVSKRQTLEVSSTGKMKRVKKAKQTVGKKEGKRQNAGRKPIVLKLSGDWRDLMKQSLQKKKPKDGWPKLSFCDWLDRS